MEVLDRIKQEEEALVENYRQNQLKAEIRAKLVDTAAQSETKLNEATATLNAAKQEFDDAHATVDAYDQNQGTAAEPTLLEGEAPLEPAA